LFYFLEHISRTYVVSAFRRTVTVRLKPDTTYEKPDTTYEKTHPPYPAYPPYLPQGAVGAFHLC